jgi:phospholipid-binding lipoprotein MlaA
MPISEINHMRLLKHISLILIVLTLCACATNKPIVVEEPAKRQVSDVMNEDDIVASNEFYDPWEGYNRWMYDFNAKFDRYIFIPTVNVYKAVLPSFARTGIHNFFSNLGEFSNLANSALQGKVSQSGRTLGRLAVNSTLGIGGLMDPATNFGLYRQREDFGQTLGRWGVGPGPYFILPILGPSTLRDMPANIVDRIYHPLYEPYPWLVDIKSSEASAIGLVNAIDTRANVGFQYYEMGSPFEYLWIRNLWLEYRQLEVNK